MSVNPIVFDSVILPAELVNLVLSSCDWQSLCQLARVSKVWTTFVDGSEQWQIEALALGFQSSSTLECREKIKIYYAWHLSEQEIKILAIAQVLAQNRGDKIAFPALFSACYELSMHHDYTKYSLNFSFIKKEVNSKKRVKKYRHIIDNCPTTNEILSGWFSIKDAQLRFEGGDFLGNFVKELEIEGFPPPRQIEMDWKEVAKGLEMFLNRFAMVLKWVEIKKLEKQIQDITNQPENQISRLTLKTKKLKLIYLETKRELERALKQTGSLEATMAKPLTPPTEKPPESEATAPAPIQKDSARTPKRNEGKSYVSSILACLFSFITWMGNFFSGFFSR